MGTQWAVTEHKMVPLARDAGGRVYIHEVLVASLDYRRIWRLRRNGTRSLKGGLAIIGCRQQAFTLGEWAGTLHWLAIRQVGWDTALAGDIGEWAGTLRWLAI